MSSLSETTFTNRFFSVASMPITAWRASSRLYRSITLIDLRSVGINTTSSNVVS